MRSEVVVDGKQSRPVQRRNHSAAYLGRDRATKRGHGSRGGNQHLVPLRRRPYLASVSPMVMLLRANFVEVGEARERTTADAVHDAVYELCMSETTRSRRTPHLDGVLGRGLREETHLSEAGKLRASAFCNSPNDR